MKALALIGSPWQNLEHWQLKKLLLIEKFYIIFSSHLRKNFRSIECLSSMEGSGTLNLDVKFNEIDGD